MNDRNVSLLSLPDELLDRIVDFAFAPHPIGWHGAAGLARSCRRLARMARPRLFSSIEYGGSSESEQSRRAKLDAALDANPALRTLVQKFTYKPGDEDRNDADVDGKDVYTLPALLYMFPSITAIDFDGVNRAHAAAFFEGPPSPNDSKLRHLRVTYVPQFGGVNNDRIRPYLADWWNRLRRFSGLVKFDLGVHPDLESVPEIDFGGHRPLPLESVRTLAIDERTLSLPSAPALSALFPYLEKLVIRTDMAAIGPFKHLIQTAPASLVSLTLDCEWPFVALPGDDLPRLLTRLVNLRHLSLAVDSSDSRLLLRYLASSSLTSLTFMDYSETTDQFLVQLVSGKSRMPNLETLRLDYIAVTPLAERCSDLLRRLSFSGVQRVHRIVADFLVETNPEWPEGSTPHGLQQVVDAGRSNGIRVYGTAVDCIDWDRTIETEVERCLVGVAVVYKNRARLDEYFGREEADEVIERHAWRFADAIASAA